ncbi:MAG: hypothetical protein ACTSU2_09540 [Promethearchaeota archaeon]
MIKTCSNCNYNEFGYCVKFGLVIKEEIKSRRKCVGWTPITYEINEEEDNASYYKFL